MRGSLANGAFSWAGPPATENPCALEHLQSLTCLGNGNPGCALEWLSSLLGYTAALTSQHPHWLLSAMLLHAPPYSMLHHTPSFSAMRYHFPPCSLMLHPSQPCSLILHHAASFSTMLPHASSRSLGLHSKANFTWRLVGPPALNTGQRHRTEPRVFPMG